MTNIKVFDKNWFKKYNKAITWLARLPFVGELIFSFKRFGHYVDRNKIVEVTPNSVIEFVSWKKGYKEVELRQHFFSRNEYALRLQSVFYPIWITFHIWDIITRPIPQLNLGFDTLTVYPDASSGSTTVDGYVGRSSDNSTFSEIRTGAGNFTNVVGNQFYIQLNATSVYGLDKYGTMTRTIITFDTSSIDDGATISATVFSGYGYSKANNNGLGTPSLHICASTPAANNALANSDYGNTGTTSFSSKSYADFSTIGYNDFTLNASGIANVSKTGISRFGIRNDWDITNTPPTWQNDGSSIYSIYASDYGSNKPKLVVTYTTVVGPANVKTYKGLAAASVKTCKGLAIASVKSKKGLV